MIQFNELYISPDNQNLVIDVSVKDLDIYENVFLDVIIIDNQDTFSVDPMGYPKPSSSPVYIKDLETNYSNVTSLPDTDNEVLEEESYDPVYVLENEGNYKHYRLVLDTSHIALTNNLLFVYVLTKGVPHPSTPCGMDNDTTLGVVFNSRKVLNTSLPYIKEIERNCLIPTKFIDNILRFKAFEMALNTGKYELAIKYWNKFYVKEPALSTPSNNCPYASY